MADHPGWTPEVFDTIINEERRVVSQMNETPTVGGLDKFNHLMTHIIGVEIWCETNKKILPPHIAELPEILSEVTEYIEEQEVLIRSLKASIEAGG